MNVLKELKEVLNRMKVTSNILFIYANSSGEMEIVYFFHIFYYQFPLVVRVLPLL